MAGPGGLTKEEYEALPKKVKILYWVIVVGFVTGILYIWLFYKN